MRIVQVKPYDTDLTELMGMLYAFNEQFDAALKLSKNWAQHRLARELNLVAYEMSIPIGFATACRRIDPPLVTHNIWVEVTELFVREDHRGKGVGKALLQAVMQAAAEWFPKTDTVKLFSSIKNEAAAEFYHSQGFRPYQVVWVKELE